MSVESEYVAETIRGWLTKPSDPALVRKHPYTGLDYIPWSEKWRIIKAAFPNASVVIKERWESPQEQWEVDGEDVGSSGGFNVIVTISIPDGLGGVIVHDGLGFEPRKTEKQVDAYSDVGWKSGASDGASRAAALLGVGLDLYHSDAAAAAVSGKAASQAAPGPPCPVHGKPMAYRPGGISKKTKKPYNARYSCNVKSADGTYCREAVWLGADEVIPEASNPVKEAVEEVDDVPFDVPPRPVKVAAKDAPPVVASKSEWRLRCENGERMLREFGMGARDFEAWRTEQFGKEFITSLLGASEKKLTAYHEFLVVQYRLLLDKVGSMADAEPELASSAEGRDAGPLVLTGE